MRVTCEGTEGAVWQVTLRGRRAALDGPGLDALSSALDAAHAGGCRALLLRADVNGRWSLLPLAGYAGAAGREALAELKNQLTE